MIYLTVPPNHAGTLTRVVAIFPHLSWQDPYKGGVHMLEQLCAVADGAFIRLLLVKHMNSSGCTALHP